VRQRWGGAAFSLRQECAVLLGWLALVVVEAVTVSCTISRPTYT